MSPGRLVLHLSSNPYISCLLILILIFLIQTMRHYLYNCPLWQTTLLLPCSLLLITSIITQNKINPSYCFMEYPISKCSYRFMEYPTSKCSYRVMEYPTFKCSYRFRNTLLLSAVTVSWNTLLLSAESSYTVGS